MSSGSQTRHAHDAAAAMRQFARDVFLHALGECSIARAFERHIHVERRMLQVGEDLYDLASFSQVAVISIGKAAHAMAEALSQRAGAGLSGIVATPVEPPHQVPSFRYYRGGHPLPNEESVAGARAILRSLRALPENALVIYLISGGGSAVVEEPIDASIGLADLVATYRALVLSGAPIAEINAIRKHLSAVKGGRMARAAAGARQVSVLVSDVPDDQLDALASGPTMADRSTAEQCYRIAGDHGMLPKFPASVRSIFDKRLLEETPKGDDPAFARSRYCTVLSNRTAWEAAQAHARAAGFTVAVDNSVDDWDYAKAADHLLARLRELRRTSPRVCLISGGEVTVKVEGNGLGGRNQQFALYCATKIAGEGICVLSGGTDGIDGNSRAAGAVADGTTCPRLLANGVDPQKALAAFDAYPAFTLVGDAVETGPTGTNVRDLRLFIAY